MELKITGSPFENDGTATNAKGGTELMLEGLKSRVDPELLDKFQIICSRVRNLDPDKKAILWCHDLAGDPEVKHLADANSRARFAGLVFVSNWQFTTYNGILGVPYSGSVILRNAIVPIEEVEKPKDKINLIYHTTPHRGLEMLVPAFQYLAEKDTRLHLDVYSSFNIYGWPERNKPYERLFEECRNHPQITYHGSVPNEEIRVALQKAHIFAYPSIWPETSCIAAIEAMSAKTLVVCSDLAGLSETVGDFGYVYRYSEDGQIHINRFVAALSAAIDSIGSDRTKNLLANSKARADAAYNWNLRAAEWSAFLQSLL